MHRPLALLCTIMLLSSCNKDSHSIPHQTPSQSTPSAMTHTPEFDGNQAFTYLTAQTNCGPRNPNSAGHEKCLQYLATTLDGLAAKVTRQEFTVKGYDGEALKLTNIFASFNPDDTARILFLAHWDTRPRADEEKDVALQDRPIPGANDGASGVAILLELAAMMKKNPPPIGVDLLLVDGEDYGTRHDLDNYFLGSKHFMEVKPASYKPRFAILLDMVGYRDLRIPMEQNSMQMAPAVVELLWSTAERVGVTQFVNIPGDQISDDHLALNKGGIPTADVIDFQYPYWHTLKDTPDKCSAESLEAVGTVLAHVIYESSLHRAQ